MAVDRDRGFAVVEARAVYFRLPCDRSFWCIEWNEQGGEIRGAGVEPRQRKAEREISSCDRVSALFAWHVGVLLRAFEPP